jgi:PAS domain S-box-containing protein
MNSVLSADVDERSTPLDHTLVRAFLENIPDYVYFKDRQSRFITVSRSLARYLEAESPGQLIGRTDFDFFEPAYAQSAYDDEQRIIRTGQPLLGKSERGNRLDGQVRWLLTNKLPLRNGKGEIIGTFGLSKDVTKTKEVEIALEKANKDLVDASHKAGMAEVATGVLHNVGNVLNSLNVSASVIASGLRQSKAAILAKLAARLRENQSDLANYLTNDPKGKRIPEFVDSLARHAVDERQRLLHEVTALQKNIDHIKEIVSMQQTYATMVGLVEPLEPAMLMEDSLRMNAGALVRHEVQVVREFQSVPTILAEKGKVLQILVNLIRNAKYACDESGFNDKRIYLRIEPAPTADRVRLIVRDNGVGIPAENLTRIFGHGFTTRSNGHGFGLHSAANAAREMKGSLSVHSDGRGQGAVFTLELPVAPAPETAA